MKITHQCPVCGGQEIYMVLVRASGGYGPDFLPRLGGMFGLNKQYEQYICGNCGLAQFFVPNDLVQQLPKYDVYQRI